MFKIKQIYNIKDIKFNIARNKKSKIVFLQGTNSVNISFMPKYNQFQRAYNKKQFLKLSLGNLSDKKWKNISSKETFDNILVHQGLAKSIFHSRKLIRSKNISLNNNTVIGESRLIKPGSLLLRK